jgi:hypothetical protein
VVRLIQLRAHLDEVERLAAGLLKDLGITGDVGDAEAKQAALLGAVELARADLNRLPGYPFPFERAQFHGNCAATRCTIDLSGHAAWAIMQQAVALWPHLSRPPGIVQEPLALLPRPVVTWPLDDLLGYSSWVSVRRAALPAPCCPVLSWNCTSADPTLVMMGIRRAQEGEGRRGT